MLLSTTDICQSRGLDISGRDESSDVLFEISGRDLFTTPCSKIGHHLICELLIMKGQILHSIGIELHLLHPSCRDESSSPRTNVIG